MANKAAGKRGRTAVRWLCGRITFDLKSDRGHRALAHLHEATKLYPEEFPLAINRTADNVRSGPAHLSLEPLANATAVAILDLMKATFTYWKEADGKYLGYLNSHPDHWAQGDDLEDLKAHLRDLFEMFSAEDIPGIRKVAELEMV